MFDDKWDEDDYAIFQTLMDQDQAREREEAEHTQGDGEPHYAQRYDVGREHTDTHRQTEPEQKKEVSGKTVALVVLAFFVAVLMRMCIVIF